MLSILIAFVSILFFRENEVWMVLSERHGVGECLTGTARVTHDVEVRSSRYLC